MLANPDMISETEKEMLQSREICNNFDLNKMKSIADRIGNKNIIFSGMGSSLIFPAKNAKHRALELNVTNKIDSYMPIDLFACKDFKDTFVFLCSNSGKTKEIINLLKHAEKYGATCIAITAVGDSMLAKRCKETIVLSGGFEKGVAATKSVVEEALIFDSLILHLAKNQGKGIDIDLMNKKLKEAGDFIYENINLETDKVIIEGLSMSENFFMVGLDDGVAEEITLKAYEITRKVALFYPGTHIVHGVAEAIEGNYAIVFNTTRYADYIKDFEDFSKKTNCRVIGVDRNGGIKGLKIKMNEEFSDYCLLSGGWCILLNVAKNLDIDVDHPRKASKVGNPYQGQ